MLRKRLRAFALGTTWLLVGLLLPVALLRLFAHDKLWAAIVLNTLSTYLYLPAFFALAIAVAYRHRVLSVLAGAIVIAHLGWTLGPYARVEHPTVPPTKPLRLFSTNVMAWQTSTKGIVDEILASDADVVAVQELSPIWSEAFAAPAFQAAYPYRIERVRTDAAGSGIYARHPLGDPDVLETPSMPIARATITIDGRPIRLYSVHVLPPAHAQWVDEWNRGLSAIQEAAQQEALPVILAGDFNATPHSAWYARFLGAGWRSSHDACGRPLATTWPNGVLPIPPIRLDHVFLSRELACVSITEGLGEGSDHRPVFVTLHLRGAG